MVSAQQRHHHSASTNQNCSYSLQQTATIGIVCQLELNKAVKTTSATSNNSKKPPAPSEAEQPAMKIRLIRKEIDCVLTCMTDHNHRIVLPDNQERALGRSETVNPDDEEIPEMVFIVMADVPNRCVYVCLLDGEGFLNGEEMEEYEIYNAKEGDIIGFSENDFHQYQISFTISGIEWPGSLDDY